MEDLILTADERRALVAIARDAIRARLDRSATSPPAAADAGRSALGMCGAAFVTLRRGAQLRGCIGDLELDRPLSAVVARAAVAAAFEDPRFPPVTSLELSELSIEISVLGPMRPLRDPAGVEVGRHGLVIHAGRRRGLLLPQVATEWGWDRGTFLEQVCLKAGLARDAWRTSDLFIFEAEVFSEDF